MHSCAALSNTRGSRLHYRANYVEIAHRCIKWLVTRMVQRLGIEANAAKRRLREAHDLIEDVRLWLQKIGDTAAAERLRAHAEQILRERERITF